MKRTGAAGAYHASYEYPDYLSVTKLEVGIDSGGIWVLQHIDGIGNLPPDAARWLSNRLAEAAELLDEEPSSTA